MNIYMLMAAAVLFLALLMRGDIPQNRRYIIWACILMFIVYGLRDAYSVGNDSSTSYLQLFQGMKNRSWAELREGADLNDNLFWQLLVKTAYIVFDGNYQLFITGIAFFVTVVFGRFVYQYSVSPVQSFVYYWGLWFYSFNFNALKQSMAMSFLLIAFDSIIDKKMLRFIFAVFFASLFHFPALIFLPAYWLVKLNPRRGFLVFLATSFAAVYLWRDRILNFMVQFYYEGRVFAGEDRFLTGKVLVMLGLLVVAYILRTPSKSNQVYSASMQLVAFATVIQLFSVYNNVFERLADYYFQFSVIFVPFIFKHDQNENNVLERSGISTFAPYAIGALCLFRFNDIVTRASSYLMPYKFFFQSEHVVGELLNTKWPFM